MQNHPKIASTESGLWQDLKKQYSIVERNDVSEKIQTAVSEWANTISRKLEVENPYDEDFEKLKIAEDDLLQGNAKFEVIEGDISDFEVLKQKIDSRQIDKFWQEKLLQLQKNQSSLPKKSRKKKNSVSQAAIDKAKKKLFDEQVALRRSLHQEWRKELEQAYSEWELKTINSYRRKIFEQLQSWLELLQKLFNLLNDLSIEPGVLFDLSQGSLTDTDIEQLKRWVEYISQDEGVKKLCDMLGRLRQAEQSKREETIKYRTKINIEVPDANSREEIIGIRTGNDIENVIPEELALLADEDTTLLFNLKFIENRLMCFETQGLQEKQLEIEKTKKTEVSEEEKMGPIIVCVDTSGSMQGSPETIAKAVTLYMATRAASQNRNCYLINFSTNIETLDLSDGVGLARVLQFLKKSFHGGTDVAPALEHALETLHKENYQQSDVLTISDFVMHGLSDSLCTRIANAKKQKNKFYSLCIGSMFASKKLKHLFDKEWLYSPNNRSIQDIQDFIEKIA